MVVVVVILPPTCSSSLPLVGEGGSIARSAIETGEGSVSVEKNPSSGFAARSHLLAQGEKEEKHFTRSPPPPQGCARRPAGATGGGRRPGSWSARRRRPAGDGSAQRRAAMARRDPSRLAGCARDSRHRW